MIAELDLAGLKVMLAEATPGPWNHLGYCGQDGVIQGPRQVPVAAVIAGRTSGETGHQCFTNARLIVAAVNSLPTLIQRIEALESDIAFLRAFEPYLKSHEMLYRSVDLLRQTANALACSDKNDPLETIADNGMTVWDGMRAEHLRLWPKTTALLQEALTPTKGR